MQIITGSCGRSSSVCIPEDLWFDILSYLPVKSLVRFTTVCKTWKFMIEEPEFAHLHLKRCLNNRLGSHLLIRRTPYSYGAKFWWTLHPKLFQKNSALEEFPVPGGYDPYGDWKVEGSINGLLLLKRFPPKLEGNLPYAVLWNPSIRKSFHLPIPPYLHHHWGANCDLFLGFDPICEDYKVLMIIHQSYHPITPPSCEIFSLKTRSWRSIDAGRFSCRNHDKLAFGSCIYWIGSNYEMSEGVLVLVPCLASFDFSSEKFSYIPTVINDVRWIAPAVVGSCVEILASFSDGSNWVLKWNDQDHTWHKNHKIELDVGHPCFWYIKKDDNLWVWEDKAVTTYNLESKIHTIKSVQSYHASTDYVDSYVENLTLLL